MKPTIVVSAREEQALREEGRWESLSKSYELVRAVPVTPFAQFVFSDGQTEK